MGTSSANKGNSGRGTPSVPSWLSDDFINNSFNAEGKSTGKVDLGSIPPPADPDRYRSARANFTRFVKSGGANRESLRRSVSEYVRKTSGGTTNAAKNMGSSRRVTSNIIGFLSEVTNKGLEEVLKTLHLEDFRGKSVSEVMTGLVDFICPENSSNDAGVAREAFSKTVAELEEIGVIDVEELDLEQIDGIAESYAVNAIEIKLLNEIGNQSMFKAATPESVENINNQLHDFVKNGVSDAIALIKKEYSQVTPNTLQKHVDLIYKETFELLSRLEELSDE